MRRFRQRALHCMEGDYYCMAAETIQRSGRAACFLLIRVAAGEAVPMHVMQSQGAQGRAHGSTDQKRSCGTERKRTNGEIQCGQPSDTPSRSAEDLLREKHYLA